MRKTSHIPARARSRSLSALGLVIAGAVALPASASAHHNGFISPFVVGHTQLLSRSLSGGVPNGPSRNAVISHDQRINRVVAFESEATDLVPGDSNGQTDVFATLRQEPYGDNGTPWEVGGNELVSRAFDGGPANGPSYRPAVDGGSKTSPKCVAFISEASNLVPGDTNGVADAFVRYLTTGHTARVSVDSAGRQANAPTTQVDVSGDCERVAFSSFASNLALTRTRKPQWLNARTRRPASGVSQVYVRFLETTGADAPFRNLTLLVSANDFDRPGNGHSSDPALSGNGKTVGFASSAKNLDRGDRGSGSDVYTRSIKRKFDTVRGRGVQTLAFDTRLVSATSQGRAGDGPSSRPSLTDSGSYVAYETLASNLLPGDQPGVSDVGRADMSQSPPKQLLVSRSATGAGNGPSNRPSITAAGNSVLFDSEASNLKIKDWYLNDPNGVRDIAINVIGLDAAGIESLSPSNDFVAGPSQNPVTSARNNYVVFESPDGRLDPRFQNPGTQAIYLRYLGPK